MRSLDSRRNAVVMTVGWWLLRRKLRKSARTAVAELLAGKGLSPGARRRRRPLRTLSLLALLAGGGYLAWRRARGGGDDWGGWEPDAPVPAPAAEPARAPEPRSPAVV